MKKTIKSTISIVLVMVCLFALVACGEEAPKEGLWKNATYTEDTTLGEGAKTIVVEVTAEGQGVTFTIKTDKDTVGAALIEHKLIEGDESEFGLYVKKVNGILADYDVDKTYWAFNIDGQYATSGVDTTEIKEGVKYQLARTK